MIDREIFEEIRQAFLRLPPLAAHSTGTELQPEQMFFPSSHAEALDPEVTLVVGNRGMGKSFWAAALAQDATRKSISAAYPSARRYDLGKLSVSFAFADAEGGSESVSRAELSSVPNDVPADVIWRAVILAKLASIAGTPVPQRLKDRVEFASQDPERLQEIFRSADNALHTQGRRHLFLFDQLDQLADTWPRIQQLTQGVLRIALAMRSYRTLRVKIFIRPDQAENRELFRFPDASKVAGSRARLRWRSIDLYGLLFFELFRDAHSRRAMKELCAQLVIPSEPWDNRLRIPYALAYSTDNQHTLFASIAGPYMGASKKRGLTYTWIPAHLSDAQGEVSPRTFLKAIRTAAERVPPPELAAVDYLGIQDGVREASENRLNDLQEDYPWVSTALEPLRGLLVPCQVEDILARWEEARSVQSILREYRGAAAPLGLDVPRREDHEPSEPLFTLLTTLAEIGVVELRPNGKINVPDIFRINAGILRKGGVTPQQREKLASAL